MIYKIGILTYHSSVNYGAYMQAYSLSKRLNKLTNVKAEIINYEMPVIYDNYKKYARNIWNIKKDICAPYKLTKRISLFKKELSKLPLSSYRIYSNEYQPLFEKIKNIYDYIIVGSDAVWNWNLRNFPNAYFINDKFKAKKYSYAASSHGLDYSNISNEQKEYLNNAWSDFEFIGVRDTATEAFVKKICPSITPTHTCDPTLFLELDDLQIDIEHLEYKLKKHGIDLNKPIIGIMGGNEIGKIVRSLYGNTYQLVALYEPVKYADKFVWNLTPFEWSHIFKYFKITYTSFFHGTLLSLKNGIPTISIDYWTKYAQNYMPKMKDILFRMDLLDRYFLATDLNNDKIKLIKSKSDLLIKNNDSEIIFNAIEKECKSYEIFENRLINNIDKNPKTTSI